MFNRVLVTGGAGFIGSHTVDLLLEKGYKVRVLDNLEPQVHGNIDKAPEYLNKEAEFIHGDILDRDILKKAIDGCDAIIHDAAMVGVGQSSYQIFRYTHVNTSGTANLLDILVNEKTNVQRLLVASSMSIYGEGQYKRPSDGKLVSPFLRPDEQMKKGIFEVLDPETGEELVAVPTPETKPLISTSVYALSKKDQEEYSLLTGKLNNLPTVATRFFNAFGPRQSLSNPYTGAAAIFSSRIKNGNAPIVYEDGLQSRDFISVRDIARAQVFLMENPDANYEAYNVCSGTPLSIAGVARTLAKLMGRPDLEPNVQGSFRAGDIRHCFGDNSKLRALGWVPETSVEEGFRWLVEWSENETAIDMVEKAHQELVDKGFVRGK